MDNIIERANKYKGTNEFDSFLVELCESEDITYEILEEVLNINEEDSMGISFGYDGRVLYTLCKNPRVTKDMINLLIDHKVELFVNANVKLEMGYTITYRNGSYHAEGKDMKLSALLPLLTKKNVAKNFVDLLCD